MINPTAGDWEDRLVVCGKYIRFGRLPSGGHRRGVGNCTITLLKVDRSFINGIEQGEDDKAIVTAIIDMGHRLGLKVLAEGVETEAQLAFLRESGCDELQGYLFSRPLELERFEVLLAKAAESADFKKISA